MKKKVSHFHGNFHYSIIINNNVINQKFTKKKSRQTMEDKISNNKKKNRLNFGNLELSRRQGEKLCIETNAFRV